VFKEEEDQNLSTKMAKDVLFGSGRLIASAVGGKRSGGLLFLL